MNNQIIKLPTNIKFVLLNCFVINFIIFFPVNFLNFNFDNTLLIIAGIYQIFLLFSIYIYKKFKFNRLVILLLFLIEFSFLFVISSQLINMQNVLLLYSIPWIKWIIICQRKFSFYITFSVLVTLINYQTKFTNFPSFSNLILWVFITIGLIFISTFFNNLKDENKKNFDNIHNLKFDLSISKRVIEGLKSVSYSTKWGSSIQNFSENFKNIGGFSTSLVFIREHGTENLKLELKNGNSIENAPLNIENHPQWERLLQGNSIILDSENHELPEWINEENKYGIIVPLINEMNFFGLVYGFFESKDHVQEKFLEESKVFCYISSKYLWLVKNSSKQNSLDIILSDAGRKIEEKNQLIELKNLSLDLDKKSVTFKEKNIPISSQEFTVMKILAKNFNTYLEDSEIEESAIKENSDLLKSSVPITIYRLRKKLSKIPGGTKLIKTKRGKGYSLSVN